MAAIDDTFEELPDRETLDRTVMDATAPGRDAQRVALSRALLRHLGRETDVSTTVLVLRHLATVGGAEAVPTLVSLLTAGDPVRGYALGALQANPSSDAERQLIAALKNASGAAWRVALINALGARRASGAVAVLADAVAEGGDEVPQAALSALGAIGTRDAAAALVRITPSARHAGDHARACLLCADRLDPTVDGGVMLDLRRQVLQHGEEHLLQIAAARGIARDTPGQAVPLIATMLATATPQDLYEVAALAAELPEGAARAALTLLVAECPERTRSVLQEVVSRPPIP